MSTFQQDSLGTMTFLLSPQKILEASRKIAEKAQKLEFAGFSARCPFGEDLFRLWGQSRRPGQRGGGLAAGAGKSRGSEGRD